jgi:iron complex transport system substrate-binding protein
MLYQVAAMVDRADAGLKLLEGMRARLLAIEAAGGALPRRPRVFFEEWDEPHISAIRWVSELVGIAGGDDIFPELGLQPLGKDRIIAEGAEIVRRNPDIIIGSWCGKKFVPAKVAARPGFAQVPAVASGWLREVKSTLILQPGPAALTDGLDALSAIVTEWALSGPAAAVL